MGIMIDLVRRIEALGKSKDSPQAIPKIKKIEAVAIPINSSRVKYCCRCGSMVFPEENCCPDCLTPRDANIDTRA